MTAETSMAEQETKKPKVIVRGGGSSPVYGIGMIGACAYYLKKATTPREKCMAILKGFAWPAFLVYELLVFLNKE